MTWDDLLLFIQNLTPDQRQMDVTVLLGHENSFYVVTNSGINSPDDVYDIDTFNLLNEKQPYLIV